ncbi:UNVERIFIED_CONTAM: hypothetical protein K2H54_025001 [Gekko kuhli]
MTGSPTATTLATQRCLGPKDLAVEVLKATRSNETQSWKDEVFNVDPGSLTGIIPTMHSSPSIASLHIKKGMPKRNRTEWLEDFLFSWKT